MDIEEPKPKNKGGRPRGSINPNAICRNEILKKEQTKNANIKFAATQNYTIFKIKKLLKSNQLPIENNDELKKMTSDELDEYLINLKIGLMRKRMGK